MRFGLYGATGDIFGETDPAMSSGQVAIKRQRLLAFGNALVHAVRRESRDTQIHMSERVARLHGQCLGQSRFGRSETRIPVIGEKGGSTSRIDSGRAD